MKDYEKFFKAMEDSRVQAYYLGEIQHFEVEELYQAFKARLIDELKVSMKYQGVTFGRLEDRQEDNSSDM